MASFTLQGRILAASAAAYCIANIAWWLQPPLIHEVIVRYDAGEAAAGLVASAEMTVIALGWIVLVANTSAWYLFLIVNRSLKQSTSPAHRQTLEQA